MKNIKKFLVLLSLFCAQIDLFGKQKLTTQDDLRALRQKKSKGGVIGVEAKFPAEGGGSASVVSSPAQSSVKSGTSEYNEPYYGGQNYDYAPSQSAGAPYIPSASSTSLPSGQTYSEASKPAKSGTAAVNPSDAQAPEATSKKEKKATTEDKKSSVIQRRSRRSKSKLKRTSTDLPAVAAQAAGTLPVAPTPAVPPSISASPSGSVTPQPEVEPVEIPQEVMPDVPVISESGVGVLREPGILAGPTGENENPEQVEQPEVAATHMPVSRAVITPAMNVVEPAQAGRAEDVRPQVARAPEKVRSRAVEEPARAVRQEQARMTSRTRLGQEPFVEQAIVEHPVLRARITPATRSARADQARVIRPQVARPRAQMRSQAVEAPARAVRSEQARMTSRTRLGQEPFVERATQLVFPEKRIVVPERVIVPVETRIQELPAPQPRYVRLSKPLQLAEAGLPKMAVEPLRLETLEHLDIKPSARTGGISHIDAIARHISPIVMKSIRDVAQHSGLTIANLAYAGAAIGFAEFLQQPAVEAWVFEHIAQPIAQAMDFAQKSLLGQAVVESGQRAKQALGWEYPEQHVQALVAQQQEQWSTVGQLAYPAVANICLLLTGGEPDNKWSQAVSLVLPQAISGWVIDPTRIGSDLKIFNSSLAQYTQRHGGTILPSSTGLAVAALPIVLGQTSAAERAYIARLWAKTAIATVEQQPRVRAPLMISAATRPATAQEMVTQAKFVNPDRALAIIRTPIEKEIRFYDRQLSNDNNWAQDPTLEQMHGRIRQNRDELLQQVKTYNKDQRSMTALQKIEANITFKSGYLNWCYMIFNYEQVMQQIGLRHRLLPVERKELLNDIVSNMQIAKAELVELKKQRRTLMRSNPETAARLVHEDLARKQAGVAGAVSGLVPGAMTQATPNRWAIQALPGGFSTEPDVVDLMHSAQQQMKVSMLQQAIQLVEALKQDREVYTQLLGHPALKEAIKIITQWKGRDRLPNDQEMALVQQAFFVLIQVLQQPTESEPVMADAGAVQETSTEVPQASVTAQELPTEAPQTPALVQELSDEDDGSEYSDDDGPPPLEDPSAFEAVD